jgi:HEAT repeat protein
VLISFVGNYRTEPQYKGKSLSEWLAVYMTYGVRSAKGEEAYAAVKQIGTNALPTLVADLRYQTPAWERPLAAVIAPLRGGRRFLYTRNRSLRAQIGFSILGPEAGPAVPDLVRDLVDPEVSRPQAFALGDIGRPAWPALMVVLTTRTNSLGVRLAAMYALGNMGTNANDSIDVLLDCMKETPSIEPEWAAWVLGRVAVDPESVIPALTNALQSPTVGLRRSAVNSLSELGGRARSAVPALKTALTDVDQAVRVNATNALAQMQVPARQ